MHIKIFLYLTAGTELQKYFVFNLVRELSGLTVVALDYLVSFRFGIQATGDILESVSSSFFSEA